MKKEKTALLVILTIGFTCSIVYSHCQIPCGIYDDHARLQQISENLTTVEKSMKQIIELSKKNDPDLNQIVRWVNNKEKHADDTSEIITYYFMAQRIKPIESKDTKEHSEYVKKLTILHQMLFYSMKTKQTVDLSTVEKMRSLLEAFKNEYLNEKSHKH